MELGISSLGFILDLGLLHKDYNIFDLLFYSTEACLNTAEENDINIVEIIIDPPHFLKKERKVKFIELISSYSIRKQIHGPFIDVNLCSHNNTISKASITTYIQTAKICQEINAKIMTIHPGLANFMIKSIRDYNIEQLKKSINQLLDFTSNIDLSICLENMPKKTRIMLDDNNIEDIFSLINRNDLYLTYDTSHFFTNDGNIANLWNNFHDKIKNVHIVDNFSKETDTHPSLGTGKIDFKEIFSIFHKYNYKGPLIIELSSAKDLDNSLNFINKFL